MLAPYGGRGAYTREDHLSHRYISDEIAQNRVSATWLPGVFFAVAAFLLAVTLGRLASLQRRQIGTLRAFGYARGEVVAHYVAFALAIVGAGGAVGLLAGATLGTLLTRLYRDYYHFPALDFAVDARLLVVVATGLVAVAAAGAAGPAFRVARLAPAEAMRPPVPPAYRAGALMPGIPASARMVARGLARRPLASLATATGIAVGLALCVVGFHFQDALAVLLHTQFEVIQREDVEVVFRESLGPQADPRPRTPACGHSRGGRAHGAGAHLRRTPRTRAACWWAWRRTTSCGGCSTGDGRAVALPEDGVLMSAKLGELLAVRAGDLVDVDLLAGTRRSVSLRVAGFVDDWAGTSLWALPGVVDRVAGDGPRFTGARISAAPEALPALYRTLKEIPALATVSLRAANLATFREILDRSFLVSVAIDVAFACLIAFGLVYNGARVALAERTAELATLRVLGFTRGETAGLLLGEQAVLTIAAIPLGIALGAGLAHWLTVRLSTELYRVPFALHASTVGLATLVTIASAVASGVLVGWRVRRFDLVGVLKARE